MKNMDAQRYDRYLPKKPNGRNAAEEERVQAQYPSDPEHHGLFLTNPTLIVDAFGKVLCWYLPGVLSEARQASISPSCLPNTCPLT